MRIKRFNETLSGSSSNDLTDLKSELEFINEYDVKLYEVIEIIDKLLSMSFDEIEDWRDHIDTNAHKSKIDELTLRIIDRYCSDIEDDKQVEQMFDFFLLNKGEKVEKGETLI